LDTKPIRTLQRRLRFERMRLSLIVAMAENRMIGLDGAMPWHISADLKYFKRVTMGAPVIMGRKTFQSIGRALPGRTNIVITRGHDFADEGIDVVHDLEAAIRKADAICLIEGREEVFVIGGAQIYELSLAAADRIYLTEIHAAPPGDTAFPELDPEAWKEVSRDAHPAESDNGPAFSFVILDKVG
jgi:dihydrofolate reductase